MKLSVALSNRKVCSIEQARYDLDSKVIMALRRTRSQKTRDSPGTQGLICMSRYSLYISLVLFGSKTPSHKLTI